MHAPFSLLRLGALAEIALQKRGELELLGCVGLDFRHDEMIHEHPGTGRLHRTHFIATPLHVTHYGEANYSSSYNKKWRPLLHTPPYEVTLFTW